jgi:oxygen-independent coproporphyrinogen-3 oxidase
MNPRHVYIHVPFCARKCSYCDFAIAVRRTVPVQQYLDALARELTLRYPRDIPTRIDTLYLGGGTPSRLGGHGIAALMGITRRHFLLDTGAEVTIEANPDDVTRDDAVAWKAAGITRVSLGVQSFGDTALRWMHRTHDAARVPRAVDALRAAGIDDCSLDLIFALPPEAGRDWACDLTRAIELAPTHISLYGLTIEPMTPLGRRQRRGETVDAPEERYETEYLHAHDALTAAGFEHYEVSNFGKPGHRARHNSAYWRKVPYAGIGPGAHEFDGAARRWNAREYAAWVERLGRGLDPVDGSESLTAENQVAESVYLGLRTADGLLLEPGEHARIHPWLTAGWGAASDPGRLVLSPLGWLRLDSLSADLAHHRSRD